MLLRCARGKAVKTLKLSQVAVLSRGFAQSIKQSLELSHTTKRGVPLTGRKPVLMNQLPNQAVAPVAMVAPRAATSAVSCLLTKAANSLIADHSISQSIDQWSRFDILTMTHNDRKQLFNHYSATCLRHAHAYLQQQRKQSQSHSDSLSDVVAGVNAESAAGPSASDASSTSAVDTDDQKPSQKSKAQLKRERKALERTGAVTVAETEEQKLAQEWSVMIANRASELLESFRNNSAAQSSDSELEPLLQYDVTLHANEMNETKRGGGVIDINIRPREQLTGASTAASMEFDHQTLVSNPPLPPSISFTPIGYLDSCYKLRYGTPRQGSITPNSKARLTLLPHVSHHSLIGLEEYSHVWLVFVFHDNENKQIHPKVEPPRLGGSKVGLFASRTPHRYNPVGLSLVRLDRVEWQSRVIEFSGIDLLHGTPIIDIKPYHPSDSPLPPTSLPAWLHEKPSNPLTVEFTDAANQQMTELLSKMEFYTDLNQAKSAIVDSISFDPRPLYVKARREAEAVYGFRFDSLNVSYSVDDDKETATICCVEYVTVDDADTKDLTNPVSQLLDEKERTVRWLQTVGRSNRFSFIEQKRAEKKQKTEHSAQEHIETESSSTV